MTYRHLTTLAAVLLLAAAGCGETRPATGSANDCSACHGFPPATLTAGGDHPQSDDGPWVATDCAVCHFTSVDATTGAALPPPGGTHADGKIDGKHADYSDPAVHGPAANQGIALCQSCHGSDLTGGTASYSCTQCHTADLAFTNCTLCHGTFNASYTAANLPESAPPEDVGGATAVTVVTVGVHQAHVTATLATPIACEACHAATTPADVFAAGHIDGAPAEVPFGGDASVAKTGGRSPAWDRTGATCASTWCHDQGGATPSPVWTTEGALGCGACHLAAPSSGRHPLHAGVRTCGDCHTGFTTTTVVPALHVNGLKDVPRLPTTACHPFGGSDNYGSSCDGRSDW